MPCRESDDMTGCNIGDILTFAPLGDRRFEVVAINPLTIKPLDSIRVPLRWLVQPSSADAPDLKPETPKR
jgi:hypothetical protein